MDIITATSTKTQYNLIQDDILHWAASYTGKPYHAILCDPPYHLTTITKRFGKPDSAPAKAGVYNRASKGFMGTDWDGTDEQGKGIAFKPETWAALGEHLYPGGFLMAFAGTRGYHRMACAIEDAGFIIHPALVWTFLSGFPKATRIDTQIDKRKDWEALRQIQGVIKEARIRSGKTLKQVGEECNEEWWYRGGFLFFETGLSLPTREQWHKLKKCLSIGDDWDLAFEEAERESLEVSRPPTKGYHGFDGTPDSLPATPLAQTWAGHRYGLQALKPALEFIAVAQKPYEGRPIDCITQTGAGALNIEAGRIPGPAWKWGTQTDIRNNGYGSNRPSEGDIYAEDIESNPAGRWPANLILDEAGAILLDRQSGILTSGARAGKPGGGWPVAEASQQDIGHTWGSDSGGASRMFFQSDWRYEILEQLENADPLHYEPKVSTAERNAGLDDFPLSGNNRYGDFRGTEDHAPKTQEHNLSRNNHPCLKPISLVKYLCKLLSPPDAYAPRRLLIPFAGAGSEVCGAILSQGWEEITGIEMNPEYIKLAQARAKFWQSWMLKTGSTDPAKILELYNQQDKEVPEEAQLRLWEGF